MRSAKFFLILLVAGAFSGCAAASPVSGSGTAQTSPTNVAAPSDAPASSAADLGAIHGRVFSDEAMPIGGASVSLFEPIQLSVSTDADGLFFFEKLEPGSYSLQVAATGYEGVARKFDVRTGEVTEAKFVLKAILVASPYAASFVDEFYFTCTFGVGPAGWLWFCSNGANSVFTNDKHTFVHPSDRGLNAFVSTLTWTPNQALGARRMEFNPYLDSPRSGETKIGPSPVTVTHVLPETTTQKANMTGSVWAGRYCTATTPTDCASDPPYSLVQVVVDQRLTAYTTLFYFQPPPAGYTGVPK